MFVRRDTWKPTEADRWHPVIALRRFGGRYPEWWVLLGAAAAWVWMIAVPHPHASPHASHHAFGGGTGFGVPGAGWLAVMVVAMMAPLAVSGVRHVALGSTCRGRAVAEFMAGYLAVWIPAVVLIAAAWGAASQVMGARTAVALAVAAAVLWELAPARGRRLARCERTVPLAPRGWRASRDCVRFGAERGVSCVATCWALMAACVAFAHSLPVMVILCAVRLAPHHQRLPSRAFAVLGVCLAAVVGLAG